MFRVLSLKFPSVRDNHIQWNINFENCETSNFAVDGWNNEISQLENRLKPKKHHFWFSNNAIIKYNIISINPKWTSAIQVEMT